MSEVVFNRGTLTRIHYKQQGFETVEDYCKHLCDNEGIEKSKYYNNYIDLVQDKFYEEYLISNSNIFKINNVEEDSRNFVFLTPLSEDVYTYITEFYNGGTCLCEILTNELNKYEQF